jgi:hypothetical protein
MAGTDTSFRSTALMAAGACVVAGTCAYLWQQQQQGKTGSPGAGALPAPPAAKSGNGTTPTSTAVAKASVISGQVELPSTFGLRHVVQKGLFSGTTMSKFFDDIQPSFVPQAVNYRNTSYDAARWKISCFMEYRRGVATGKIGLCDPLREVSLPFLDQCDELFAQWMEAYKGPATRRKKYQRVQSFITRYRAVGVETHLPKHIDGGDVDGSVVVGMPTAVPFEGGGLTVWDGPGKDESSEYVYDLQVRLSSVFPPQPSASE